MVVQMRKDININSAILNLSLLTDIDKNIPTGILINGVSIAIPGKPKFLLTRTISRFQEVKTRVVLFGNKRLNH